jgi:hypothetical protein
MYHWLTHFATTFLINGVAMQQIKKIPVGKDRGTDVRNPVLQESGTVYDNN